MRAVGPAPDGDSEQALLQGVQAMPFHEDDHARWDARFATASALRNRTQRGSARGRAPGAREDARAERLSANAQGVGGRVSSGERIARPMVAVDTVLFAIKDGRLQTSLVGLRRGPGPGKWAFPEGLVPPPDIP